MKSRKAMAWTSFVASALRRLFAPLAGSGRGFFGILALSLLFVVTAYVGWAKWGDQITKRPEFVLTAESFEITPQPPWIRSDIKAAVMRDGSLRQLSLLDPDLTKRVVQAFELNAWVAGALQASKRAGRNGPRVIVQLRYREPVIMVRTRDPAVERRLLLAGRYGGHFPAAGGVFGEPDTYVFACRSRQSVAGWGGRDVVRRPWCDGCRENRRGAQERLEFDRFGVDSWFAMNCRGTSGSRWNQPICCFPQVLRSMPWPIAERRGWSVCRIPRRPAMRRVSRSGGGTHRDTSRRAKLRQPKKSPVCSSTRQQPRKTGSTVSDDDHRLETGLGATIVDAKEGAVPLGGARQ